MNTRICLENPNEKNHQLSLELEGASLCRNQQKGTRHTVYPIMPTFVVHRSYTPTFYKLNARAFLKQERGFSHPLKHSLSLKRKPVEHSSFGCLSLHNKEHVIYKLE